MSWSQADARDRLDGQPVSEAPRTLVDAVGGWSRLPFSLDAKGEFGYVKAKSLGDGFTGVPTREIRLELSRGFGDGRWLITVNGQLNNGYSGQTLETLAVGGEPIAFEHRRRASSVLRSGFRELFLWSVGGQTCGNLMFFEQWALA
jgi:hypothetical protein